MIDTNQAKIIATVTTIVERLFAKREKKILAEVIDNLHFWQIGKKGDKGERGDVGPQGPKGDKGDVGDQGPRGFTGVQEEFWQVAGCKVLTKVPPLSIFLKRHFSNSN
jgi:hypothetical protein